MLNAIVALDRNSLIGDGDLLPWKIPEDEKYYLDSVRGKVVIVGRRTFAGLKVLPDSKLTIVMSRSQDVPRQKGVALARSVAEAIKLAGEEGAFVIGGAEVYSMFAEYIQRLYVTHIDAEFEGNTFFPWESFREFVKIDCFTGASMPKCEYCTYVRHGINE